MGTGKSAVGEHLAKKLKVEFIDTDEIIEEISKKSIPDIFAQEGEAAFRGWERQAITQALKKANSIISVGGGAVCSEANLKKLKKAGVLILLKASPDTILKRTQAYRYRPLLNVKDPRGKIKELLACRAPFYDQIPWQIKTDALKVSQIVGQIAGALPFEERALQVSLGKRSYPIYFEREGFKYLNPLLKRHCPSGRVILVTNATLDVTYGRPLKKILEKEFKVHKVVLPDGEKYKNLKTVSELYRQLVKFRVDRKTPLIALGGGVLGDIVGFAAASYLRGVPLVQIPTTLLAQVDSSIGGKTGVDLPEGKNLVGAFYQPKFVLIDESCLKTLNKRQFICGLAEVIKYAAIFDAKLFKTLERDMGRLLSLRGKGLEAIIRRCCEWKAWVVENDEFETLGLRSKLNFGHTLGHAIESLTRYRKYTHGEAIAMGMVFAAEKSVVDHGLSAKALARLKGLLETAGLPIGLPKLGKRAYLGAMTQDKKRVSSQVNFVYLEKIGRSVVVPTPLEELM